MLRFIRVLPLNLGVGFKAAANLLFLNKEDMTLEKEFLSFLKVQMFCDTY